VKFRLGVTGGIGSGKSTICKVFNVLGIPVFSSDDEARIIMDTDLNLRDALNSITGTDIYPGGKLDRSRMAELIFNDDQILKQVNKAVHPLVLDAFNSWCEQQETDYVILETALLFESKLDWKIDQTVSVIAPLEERIMRVMERNTLTREQVNDRIKNQMSESEMISKSDFIINNADNSMILPEVIRIHNDVIQIIGKK